MVVDRNYLKREQNSFIGNFLNAISKPGYPYPKTYNILADPLINPRYINPRFKRDIIKWLNEREIYVRYFIIKLMKKVLVHYSPKSQTSSNE